MQSRPPHGGRGLKFCDGDYPNQHNASPSPRRAWIEMLYRVKKVAFISVSPSPRRAWIEIMSCALHSCTMLSSSTRKAQSETGGYIKYIRKHDNCLFIVLEQRFLNIETAPCSQIQDAAIIGLQYSKTSMLYARQLKSIIDIYSLSPFFHLLRMIFCIFSHEAMFQIFRSIRRKIPPFRYGRPPFRCL